jgi:hypothetical protein
VPEPQIVDTPHGPHLLDSDGRYYIFTPPDLLANKLFRRRDPPQPVRGAWSAWTGR